MNEQSSELIQQPTLQIPESTESVKTPPLDAVIVAGMGPVQLEDIAGSNELFTASPYARRNSQAAKLLAGRNLSKEIYMSGFQSNKNIPHTEAAIQGYTYDRMIPTHLPVDQREAAHAAAKIAYVEENKAETTFANILRSLNLLDTAHNGHFDGNIAILSSRFHLPRIQEMLKAFGLGTRGSVLSAEDIMSHYGYDKIDPVLIKLADGSTASFQEKLEETYKNQPGGLQNLQDNPAYVTFELAKIESNQRLQEVATSLKRYYQEKNIPLPDCYNHIPDSYQDNFDYNTLRAEFSAIPFTKHAPIEGALTTDEYKQLAHMYAKKTSDFLIRNDPEPPQVHRQVVTQEV